jgi:hypothetical protein
MAQHLGYTSLKIATNMPVPLKQDRNSIDPLSNGKTKIFQKNKVPIKTANQENRKHYSFL